MPTTRIFKRTLLIVALVTCPQTSSAAELQPVDVDQFFVTPNSPSLLRWRVTSGRFDEPVEYAIRDYWGQSVITGRATETAEGAVEVTVNLATGFHEIDFPAAKQRFGVVALPAYQGDVDRFFAIDAAMSWLVRGDEIREGLIKILRRSGVGMSRERLNWGQINPAHGKWDWDTTVRYETVRHMYAKHQVEVLEMFHSAPAWIGKVGKYPQDLVATAHRWEQIGRRWQPTWRAMEVWNEPDILFGDYLPADQYVPLVEAIAYAFHRGRVDVPIVGGVFAHYDQRFLDTAARNGLLDSIDVASFHTYARAPDVETLIAKYRSWLEAYDRSAMPLWITECGRPWPRGTERPSVEQGTESALDITMKAVEARACGIARHFPFVYPFYEERNSNFGMMGRRATPLRSMAAYAQMVLRLAHKRYLGDLKTEDPSIRRARLFGNEKETIAVLYTAKADPAATVKIDLTVSGIEGIDGRTLETSPDGTLPIPDGLTYVWLDRNKLGARLRTDTAAMRLWTFAERKPPKRPAPSPILLRFEPDPDVEKAGTEGYRVSSEDLSRLPLRARVFNLDSKPHQLKLTLSLPEQGHLVDGSKVQSVGVPAESAANVSWQVDLREAFAKTDGVTVQITPAGDVERIAPLVVDFLGGATFAQILGRFANPIRLSIEDPTRWQPHVGGGGRMTITSEPDVPWRLNVTFGEGDRWVYPSFKLPEEVDLSRASALVLRARCHRPAAVRVFLWEGDDNVGYLTRGSIIPADGEWYPAVVRFRELVNSLANAPDTNHRLDLDRVRRIAIGINSDVEENMLDVSEVHIVGNH